MLVVKNLTANAKDIRDVGLLPELGRSPRRGHGNQPDQGPTTSTRLPEQSAHYNRRAHRWPTVHVKMPSITNHGNSNQNHSKIITSHLSEWLLSTRQQISGAGKDIREKRNLVHYWWKCKSVQPLWKTVQRLLKKLKIELPYYPAIPSPGTYQKKWKH